MDALIPGLFRVPVVDAREARARPIRAGAPQINANACVARTSVRRERSCPVASDQLLGKTKHSRAALRHRVRRRRALSLSVALSFARFSIRATPPFIRRRGHDDPCARLSLDCPPGVTARFYPGRRRRAVPGPSRVMGVDRRAAPRSNRATQHKQCCAVHTVSLCAEQSRRTKSLRFPRCFSTTTLLRSAFLVDETVGAGFILRRSDYPTTKARLGQRPRNASVGDLSPGYNWMEGKRGGGQRADLLRTVPFYVSY